MILIVHPVKLTFGVHGSSVEKTRLSDSEFADVNHFLHFAESFLIDFTHLEGYKVPEVFFMTAQSIADLSYNFSPLGCWNNAPFEVSLLSFAHQVLIIFESCIFNFCNKRAISR